MQSSRRHDDYAKKSPSSLKQRRIEAGHESYPIARRSNSSVDRPPRLQQQQQQQQLRSLSPRSKTDGSRRAVHREGRSCSTERRDYGWHLGAGTTEKVHSGSPQYVQKRKKPHFDNRAMHRKYKYVDDMDYDDGKSNRLKQTYLYDHHAAASRVNKEEDYPENRILGTDRRRIMAQKSMPVEDAAQRGSYQVPSDSVPPSNYGETCGHLPSMPRNMDIGHFEHEELQYREPMHSNKIPAREFYEERENPIFHSRNVSYNRMSAPHLKDLDSSSRFNDFSGSSSGFSRGEIPSSYREGMRIAASDEYPRGSVKFTEPVDFNTYNQRSVMDIRDHESDERIMTSYPQGPYNPKRASHDHYVYSESEGIVDENRAYSSVDMHRMMSPPSSLEYEHAPTVYEQREFSRPSIMHPIGDKIDHADGSYINMRKSTVFDHPTIKKKAAIENLDTGRLPYASKHNAGYLGPAYTQVDFGQDVLQDNGKSHFGVAQDHQIPQFRSNYGFGRDAGPQFQKEIVQDPRMPMYDLEMQRLAAKGQRMREELAMYEPSDNAFKRKYIMEEDVNRNERKYIVENDINRHDRRNIISSKWNAPREFEDLYDSDEEWVNENTGVMHVSRTQRFDQSAYRNAKRTYDRRDNPGDPASDDWLSPQDSVAHAPRHSMRRYKPAVKYIKGHPRSGPLSWYNSHQTDRRSGVHRQHRVWKRNDEYGEDEHALEDDQPEDWVNLGEAEPSEDSEEFKQLVDDATLRYSKKLNLNSAVRRRYKEQGKAGSLFCIVCGKSASKEFMATHNLVQHAFMSHKIGLRARHLGLHRAICILMGWNSTSPCNTITCVPEVLPDEEAFAQKEDLMLWPPLVIIHNISMSNNNPEQQKVIPIEGVEAFLRGKGFVGGKIKVCLGKPADQSVMLVKFLSTFTGLGNAERLHKYFAEKKHGRLEFERGKSNNNDNNNYWEEEIQGGKLEEQLLYGYLGIADDLDWLDFNTKKWIDIKSKKEIQDVANAPVKTDER